MVGCDHVEVFGQRVETRLALGQALRAMEEKERLAAPRAPHQKPAAAHVDCCFTH
jgi:hypothetical protein